MNHFCAVEDTLLEIISIAAVSLGQELCRSSSPIAFLSRSSQSAEDRQRRFFFFRWAIFSLHVWSFVGGGGGGGGDWAFFCLVSSEATSHLSSKEVSLEKTLLKYNGKVSDEIETSPRKICDILFFVFPSSSHFCLKKKKKKSIERRRKGR